MILKQNNTPSPIKHSILREIAEEGNNVLVESMQHKDKRMVQKVMNLLSAKWKKYALD